MKLTFALMAVLLLIPAGVAQEPADSATTREVTSMLRQFLDGASRGDREVFNRFFADDVIYTRATGAVTNKQEILRNVENLKPTAESKTTYSAEDVTVHNYGNTAIVAFRLVARTEHKDGKVEQAFYRNTGTFLRTNSRWQVVAWQATKIAENAGAR